MLLVIDINKVLPDLSYFNSGQISLTLLFFTIYYVISERISVLLLRSRRLDLNMHMKSFTVTGVFYFLPSHVERLYEIQTPIKQK